jgi:predicted nuclease of predicted toxin-antitoxin system
MTAFKLDESLSPTLKAPLLVAGHDVQTVADENLRGAADMQIAEVCRREARCLITADEDFAQILRYPPDEYFGLVVLRDPRPTLQRLHDLLGQFLQTLAIESPGGKLWIVEPGRVRVYEPEA